VLNAFIFAAVSAIIIILISRRKNTSPEIMILTGIAISYFFSSCTTVLQVFAEPWAVTEVVFWMVGSLAKGTWENLGYMFPVVIICVPYLIFKSWDLNIIGTGDDAAKSMGISVERTRICLMVLCSLVTASVVCFTGTIGFVGLVAPHIARMSIGGDNTFVVPAAGLIGAFLLVLSDLVAVNIVAPVILPIGVVTSFMGLPLFVYFILKRKGLMP
jgi:iron complex transport system permease protein